MSAGISDQRMKGQGNQGMFGPSFGQQSSYNYFPNNGENYNKNAWDSQQVNGASRRGYDDYYRGNDKQRAYGNDGIKSIEHGVQGMGLDGGNQRDSYSAKANSQSNTAPAAQPKKTTWASIASQPVKSSQTRISSTLKKKPGMPSHIKVPPPPMIPGKHNMDIGLDSDKNGTLVPPPVPSPPPVIDEPSPFQFPTKNHSNANNNSANNNSEQSQAPPNRNDYRDERGGPMGRDRDDRGPMNRDRDGGWHRRDNGYQQQNRYQPRSNYGPPNHDRQMNYQENRNYQPRPHYRASPPHNQQYYGPNRNENPPEPQVPVVDAVPKPPKIEESPPVHEKVLDKENYNPGELDVEQLERARFFIIKSYSEDDVHRSIKYEIWCSTEHGNKRLDQAFRDAEADGGEIFLLFSVNGSGHFCGVAKMTSAVDYNSVSSVWHQDKWKGKFSLQWVYVKDVPNAQLRHIRLENNENKPVTNSRDTQEVPNAKGQQVMQIIHMFKHSTSIFDDIEFYEQRQVEEDTKRVDSTPPHEIDDRGPKRGGFHRNDGNFRDGPGYDYRQNRNHGNYPRDQGNNRGYHNSYDNRRGGDDFSRNYDRPPPNRDYNRRDGGFMSRDRGERDNNRFDYRDRMDRNDDHHQGGFKRNYSKDFGNRASNNGGGPNTNSNYRNDRNERIDRNDRIERTDRIERSDRN